MTYDSIIKGFTKTITKLEKLAETNKIKEEVRTATIRKLKTECQELESESVKAINTASKLRSLLEG